MSWYGGACLREGAWTPDARKGECHTTFMLVAVGLAGSGANWVLTAGQGLYRKVVALDTVDRLWTKFGSGVAGSS